VAGAAQAFEHAWETSNMIHGTLRTLIHRVGFVGDYCRECKRLVTCALCEERIQIRLMGIPTYTRLVGVRVYCRHGHWRYVVRSRYQNAVVDAAETDAEELARRTNPGALAAVARHQEQLKRLVQNRLQPDDRVELFVERAAQFNPQVLEVTRSQHLDRTSIYWLISSGVLFVVTLGAMHFFGWASGPQAPLAPLPLYAFGLGWCLFLWSVHGVPGREARRRFEPDLRRLVAELKMNRLEVEDAIAELREMKIPIGRALKSARLVAS